MVQLLLQNPGFPSAHSGTSALTYTVAKCSNGKLIHSSLFAYNTMKTPKYFIDVCMIRLDFETLTLRGPASTAEPDNGHNCLDTFQVEVILIRKLKTTILTTFRSVIYRAPPVCRAQLFVV